MNAVYDSAVSRLYAVRDSYESNFIFSLVAIYSQCTVHTSDVLKAWIHMDPNYLAGFNIIYKAEFDNGEWVCYGMFS